MPRGGNLNYREIKKRLIKEYPIFVAGVLEQINDEAGEDYEEDRVDNRTRGGIRDRGRVTNPNDRRLKQNRIGSYRGRR